MKKISILIIMLIIVGCTSTTDRIDSDIVEGVIDSSDIVQFKKFSKAIGNLNKLTDDGETLLIKVARDNNIKMMEYLLIEGADPNREVVIQNDYYEGKRGDKRIALHYVNSKEALNLLVDYGGNYNYVDNTGSNLLVYYLKNKDSELASAIIYRDIDLNYRDREGWTVLNWSVLVGDLDVTKELLKLGMNPAGIDNAGNYPIYYTFKKEMLLLLLGEPYIKRYNLNHYNNSNENVLGEVLLKGVVNNYYDVVEKLLVFGVNPHYVSRGIQAEDLVEYTNNKNMKRLLKSYY